MLGPDRVLIWALCLSSPILQQGEGSPLRRGRSDITKLGKARFAEEKKMPSLWASIPWNGKGINRRCSCILFNQAPPLKWRVHGRNIGAGDYFKN